MNKNKLDKKRLEHFTKQSVKCKCGHTVFLNTHERLICTFCGHWVYKNDKIEFKYKMLENIKKPLK